MAPALTPAANDVVLVPVSGAGNDTFVVYGGDLSGGLRELLELQPLTVLPLSQQAALGSAVARSVGATSGGAASVGALNVGVQALDGYVKAQGLVRLAPETMSLLRAGAQPLSSAGWNLGTLAVDGKIAAQVRWVPAGTATAAGVLASAGTAMTMLAIQWQLNKITGLLQRNTALTETMLNLMRDEQMAEVRAHYHAVAQELQHAQAIGGLHPYAMDELSSQGTRTQLDKFERLYLESLRRHATQMDRLVGAKARREWIGDEGANVLRDVEALLLAHRAQFAYHALRAAHLAKHYLDVFGTE